MIKGNPTECRRTKEGQMPLLDGKRTFPEQNKDDKKNTDYRKPDDGEGQRRKVTRPKKYFNKRNVDCPN